MRSFADQLVRLRVAVVTGTLPPDLGAWAVAELAARACAADRRELRDQLLVRAALALVPDGSTWARACALNAELIALRRRNGEHDAARALIAAALELDPGAPRSTRHLHTILKLATCRFQADIADGLR